MIGPDFLWLPSAGRDCQAFVVGTKAVVQPVCSHTHIQAIWTPSSCQLWWRVMAC